MTTHARARNITLEIAGDLIGGGRDLPEEETTATLDRIGTIWGALVGIEVGPSQVALMLAGMKLAIEAAPTCDPLHQEGTEPALKAADEAAEPESVDVPAPADPEAAAAPEAPAEPEAAEAPAAPAPAPAAESDEAPEAAAVADAAEAIVAEAAMQDLPPYVQGDAVVIPPMPPAPGTYPGPGEIAREDDIF